MPVNNLGDMSQSFQSLRQTIAIKTRLNTLAQEMSSGLKSDLTAALRGDTTRLSEIDRTLSVLDAFAETRGEAARSLEVSQTVLDSLDELRNRMSGQFLLINTTSDAVSLRNAAALGRDGFDMLTNGLNTRLGDRTLFAGNAVDGPALAPPSDMIANILTAIGGVTDAPTIAATVDTWFNDPAGGFATMGYVGDDAALLSRQVAEGESVDFTARADAAPFRALLQGAALAAVAEELSGTLDNANRKALVTRAGDVLLAAGNDLSALRGQIGADQQRLEEITTRAAAQRTTFAAARNDLTRVDQFETASALQDVQLQLELHFNTTARLSRLSLANYL